MSKIGMMDVLSMMYGAEPKSVGRIVTGFNGVILGLETSDTTLDEKTVYDIQDIPGVGLMLVPIGESHIDFETENRDISTILVCESKKLILTDREKKKYDEMRLNEEKLSQTN